MALLAGVLLEVDCLKLLAEILQEEILQEEMLQEEMLQEEILQEEILQEEMLQEEMLQGVVLLKADCLRLPVEPLEAAPPRAALLVAGPQEVMILISRLT